MSVYYNELDQYAAAWLRELIAAGHLPNGYVDTRSIWDIAPEDLNGYTQHHFFAGIGGWPYALQLAGWPDDRPVWTGSCPCQPFSSAGKGAGFDDERHLWPAWHHLIRLYRPPVVFGEQVAAAINHGWLDLVQDDLEGEGYAFGAVGVPAASVGAPHTRYRLFFVGHTRSSYVSRFIQQGTDLRSIQSPPFGQHCLSSLHAGFHNTTDSRVVGAIDGLSRPVGLVKGFGNAIVPQVAAEVIKAYMSVNA